MSRLISKKVTLKSNDLPVNLADVKEYLRVDFDDDDALIEALIRSSVDYLHEYLRRVIVPSSVEAWYKQECGGDQIALSFSDNIVLTGDALTAYGTSLFGDTILKTEETEVHLTYDAGIETIPDWFKTAIMINVAWRYDNRGDVAAGKIDPETMNYLKPYVNWSFL